MTIPLRPTTGGFVRAFDCAWFIIEYLKGKAPEGSGRIDPSVGTPMTDIHSEYKLALHRAYAKDTVERVEEKRIRRGKQAFTEEEYQQLLEYYLSRIPYKLTKMRYSSFTRYFGHLKRLGWVEETGKVEPSALQDYYPPAPSRVYYRLTEAGRKATLAEMSNPIRTLYPNFNEEYYREKRRNRHYYSKKR